MDERNASFDTKGRGDGRDSREARLAEALRANLRRRKAAVAAKAKGAADPKGG